MNSAAMVNKRQSLISEKKSRIRGGLWGGGRRRKRVLDEADRQQMFTVRFAFIFLRFLTFPNVLNPNFTRSLQCVKSSFYALITMC